MQPLTCVNNYVLYTSNYVCNLVSACRYVYFDIPIYTITSCKMAARVTVNSVPILYAVCNINFANQKGLIGLHGNFNLQHLFQSVCIIHTSV